MTLAALKFAGFALSVNAKQQLFIISTAALKWQGFALGVDAKTFVTVSLATLAYIGQALGIATSSATSITAAKLTLSAQLNANGKAFVTIATRPPSPLCRRGPGRERAGRRRHRPGRSDARWPGARAHHPNHPSNRSRRAALQRAQSLTPIVTGGRRLLALLGVGQ